MTNFHESYRSGVIKPPSERSTGLVFAGVAVILSVLWRGAQVAPWVALALAAALAIVSFTVPSRLRPLNILWFRVGLLLHRIINPLVMFAIFVVVFVPAGLVMRLWRDPLRAQRTTNARTYWIERQASDTGSMRNQF